MLTLNEAVSKACEEQTLLDALSWICVWESERAIDQARNRYGSGANGAGWDTCFRVCLHRVMESYQEKLNRSSDKMMIEFDDDYFIAAHQVITAGLDREEMLILVTTSDGKSHLRKFTSTDHASDHFKKLIQLVDMFSKI